jgi:hypothetical protein
MTAPFAKLEAMARELCESRRGKGAYDRKYCKRAHWRKLAMDMRKRVNAQPILRMLYRACGWQI